MVPMSGSGHRTPADHTSWGMPVQRGGRSSPPPMVGVILLVVVGLAVLAVSALTEHRIAGQPVVDWPAPPSVGSCVGVPGGDPAAVVACAKPHLAEVTNTFAATDPR